MDIVGLSHIDVLPDLSASVCLEVKWEQEMMEKLKLKNTSE